jgi:hypothetical protein
VNGGNLILAAIYFGEFGSLAVYLRGGTGACFNSFSSAVVSCFLQKIKSRPGSAVPIRWTRHRHAGRQAEARFSF